METIVLMGSEDVERAGVQMAQAAETIRQAANQIEFVVSRLIEKFDEVNQ